MPAIMLAITVFSATPNPCPILSLLFQPPSLLFFDTSHTEKFEEEEQRENTVEYSLNWASEGLVQLAFSI